MISVPRNKPQHVIPTWNNYTTACQKGELARYQPDDLPLTSEANIHFSKTWEEFTQKQSLEHAADALATAICCRKTDEAKQAAEFIQSRSEAGSLA